MGGEEPVSAFQPRGLAIFMPCGILDHDKPVVHDGGVTGFELHRAYPTILVDRHRHL